MKKEQTIELTNFIRNMVTAIANVSLYSCEHPQVLRLCAVAHKTLDLAIGSDPSISLMRFESQLVVDGVPLVTDIYITRFSQALEQYGISHVKFMHGIRQQELHSLICSLSKQKDYRKKISPTDNIRFGNIEERTPEGGVDLSDSGNGIKARTIEDIHKETITLFKEIHAGINKKRPIDIRAIINLVNGFVVECKKMTSPLQALATLRDQDEYTFVHSANVCILNLAQAKSIGINGSHLYDIGIAALLHDIGKLFVPQEVLNKPGSLDEAEMELIRQHPVKGGRYLLNSPDVPRLAVITTFEHHMKFDLTGYPQVTPGWKLNICSEITMISDFFDGMRTGRVYSDPLDYDGIASRMLSLAGTAFNPALTENFLQLTSAAQTSPLVKSPGESG